MSLIAWPTGLNASGFTISLSTVQRSFASPYAGSEQVIDLLNDRWMVSLDLPASKQANGGAVEGFIHSLRNMTNTVNLWHMARPLPLGTISGTPITIGTHAAGAATLNISTPAPYQTLKAGDMIGVGGLLLMCAADCVSDGSGVMACPLVNRLRTSVALNAPITISKPTAPFRCTTNKPGVSYVPGIGNAVTLDFVEAVS